MATESNEVVVVPEALADRNHTVESNRSVIAEKLEIETNDYELVSNEVRVQNQTTAQPGKAQKKGKFLDQFGATEDNDINGAAWALAGMRIVDRASSKAGHASGESVEVIRDENDNSVANNTLKQLMDWAVIMQDADFANSSFVKPTTSDIEVELKNEIKDRRKYANKTPVDALSEENRLTAVVTEMIPEASVEVTSVLPVVKLVSEPTSTTLPADDDLEDFKFEDRSKVPLETTKRPELTNFIQETTTAINAKTEQVVTTVRPTRGYEVIENIDESESFALPGRSTTTGRYEASTTIEDIPVTTYSPASPIAKKVEITTEAILPTTFESMRTTRRPRPRTTTPEPTTTNAVRFVEETTPQLTTTMTTSTSSVATPVSEDNESLSNSLPQNSDEQVSSSSSEVDPNAINQTNEEIAMTTSTNAPPTTRLSVRKTTENIMTQQSTIQPTLVEFRPTTGTTDKVDLSPSQTTESAEEPTIPNQPVLIDDKNAYDTVSETTSNPIPESEPSASPEPEPTATTRRSIDRQMTTTELSEEESITEEDYVEINSSGSSSRSPLDQNQTTPTSPQPEEEEASGVVVAVVASLVSVIVVLLLVAAFVSIRIRECGTVVL